MSDTTSEEYKRGLITGLAMNPLMVTTETETQTTEPTPQVESGLITDLFESGLFGLCVINNSVICVDGTSGGV